ncbi:MAG TPA: sialate O-acetylesterase [Pyrinomonadaceae bacterium]|nr:sialate O-acetylesterase [Pyrinomonadaceae bacterium]
MSRFNITLLKLLSLIGLLFAPLPATADRAFDATQAGAPTPAATVDVWPEGKMPGRGAKEPEADRPPRGDNVRRITNVSRPTLTVFPARKTAAPAPAVVVCPGGGYSYVVFDKEGTEVAAWLNSHGVTALVLKYRVPNNREGALQDIQRALSLARAHAANWNVDPERLGVMGFSAGGNLAAKASTLFEQRAYTPLDAVDRQSSRPDFAVLVYPAYLERDGQVAADLNLKANIPPTLIVSTEDDKTFVNGSRLYKAALDAAKVSNEFLLYPTGGHGYGLRSERDVRVWPQAALDWLHRIGVLKARQSASQPSAAPAPAVVTPPAGDNFHVYLLMGQSNMVGRDTRTLASQVENPRVLALDGEGRWVVAREPMHVGGTGVGPGIPFAVEMLKDDPQITVGLVPCAVGGTPLRRWVKGADLYERAVSRAKTAARDGVVKGVLWQQGESDTGKKENADTYETRLTQMFRDLRQDLGLPELPIVVGQLGDFLTPDKYPYAETVRGAIVRVPAAVPGVGYADSKGLGHKGDQLHFSADAEIELGARFAKAMRELQGLRGSRRR